MTKIWKYPLAIQPEQRIKMPADAEILCIREQRSQPTIWAKVDVYEDVVWRHILMVGTGFDAPDDCDYIGTVFDDRGFVWHFFDAGEI